MNRMTEICASIALALTLSTTTVFADPPSAKGKEKSSQQSNAGQQGKGDDGHYDDRYDDKDKNSNHGQIVSECSHRANERNLKGQDRKEWTEWCEERGNRHNYDYRRYSSDRNCYQKADSKGLTGDQRRKFINNCLDIPNRY